MLDLSLNLKAFISQRLIPTVDGKRCAAIEILLGTPMICELIKKGEVMAIKEIMEKSEEQGMQTFDRHLYRLVQEGRISMEEALKNADSPSNIQVRMNIEKEPEPDKEDEAIAGLALEPKVEPKEEEEEEEQEEENMFGTIATAPPRK